jgi:hypothetical protein
MVRYARGGVPGFFASFYNDALAMPKIAGLKSPVLLFANNFENMGGACAAWEMPIRENDRPGGCED